MELRLKNKVALITGGSQGLGRAICIALAAEGSKVAVNYRNNPKKADNVASEIYDKFGTEVMTVYGDITIENQVRSMFEEVQRHFRHIDILINNSGICPISMIKDMTLEEWESVICTNLTGTFLTSREMVNLLIRNGQVGNIVNIASQAAYNGSKTGKTHYAASKGGVVTFTLSLAKEVSDYGIRVNAVAPGMIYTDMIAESLKKNKEKYEKKIPIGRIADADEVARAAVFLVSDAASYITGSIVDVSGGIIGI